MQGRGPACLALTGLAVLAGCRTGERPPEQMLLVEQLAKPSEAQWPAEGGPGQADPGRDAEALRTVQQHRRCRRHREENDEDRHGTRSKPHRRLPLEGVARRAVGAVNL